MLYGGVTSAVRSSASSKLPFVIERLSAKIRAWAFPREDQAVTGSAQGCGAKTSDEIKDRAILFRVMIYLPP